jgi:hypothetical protein
MHQHVSQLDIYPHQRIYASHPTTTYYKIKSVNHFKKLSRVPSSLMKAPRMHPRVPFPISSRDCIARNTLFCNEAGRYYHIGGPLEHVPTFTLTG